METKTLKIFVVDDNTADVVLIKESLQAKGISFELRCCLDGEAALRTLAVAGAFNWMDLIVLDLNLPRIGGFDVLRWIRSRPEFDKIPVAILTSSQRADDRRLASSLGADCFISKPPDLYDFVETVGTSIVDLGVKGRRGGSQARGLAHRRLYYSSNQQNPQTLVFGALRRGFAR
jgi:CheY-like chemotaxis protein